MFCQRDNHSVWGIWKLICNYLSSPPKKKVRKRWNWGE